MPGGPDRPSRTALRVGLVGIASVVVWTTASILAYRGLGFHPPATAAPVLLLLGVALAILASMAAAAGTSRPRIVAATIGLAAVGPFLLTSFVPGVAQPKVFPIPGAPTLVASASPDGNPDLWLIHGGQADSHTRLTMTPDVAEVSPDLSPNGRQVVYSSDQSGDEELWLMTLDATGHPDGTRRLTSDPANDEEPRFSPDGQTVLFTQVRTGEWNIVSLDLATSKQTPLTTDGGSANPAWSPDGRTIVFSRGDEMGDRSAIWLMDANGHDPRRVIATGGVDFEPSISPDGRRILFTIGADPQDWDVFVANADGSAIRALTPRSRGLDQSAGWTPDGEPMFLSNRSHSGGTFLYVMNVDGSNVRLVGIL